MASGFSLIELMVVVAIISLLAGASAVTFGQFGGSSRDTERQSDLRAMQVAIENYRQQNGRYPAGCSGSGWSFSSSCPTDFIQGVGAFITPLPTDPRPGSGNGYAYRTNTDGTVYKLMARGTVESETVTADHPFQSCDPTFCGATCTSAASYSTSYAVWGGFADDIVGAGSDTADVICAP